MASPPHVSVLTVNYRSSADVAALAESLRAHGAGLRIELIVTDNSPEDPPNVESDERLAVRIVSSRTNVGYAAGVNAAGRLSRGEFLMIANPDVRVERGTLPGAVECLRQHPDVGIVLPLLRYPDGSIQASVRRFYTWQVVLFARSPLRMLAHRPAFFRRYLFADLDRSRPTDVDWGLGAAMFLRRSDWPDGEIFDERFFMYFEDVDLCYRAWRRRRRVVHCPQIECRHEHRRSSGNPLSRAGWHHFRSLVRFVQKHRGLPQRPTEGGS